MSMLFNVLLFEDSDIIDEVENEVNDIDEDEILDNENNVETDEFFGESFDIFSLLSEARKSKNDSAKDGETTEDADMETDEESGDESTEEETNDEESEDDEEDTSEEDDYDDADDLFDDVDAEHENTSDDTELDDETESEEDSDDTPTDTGEESDVNDNLSSDDTSMEEEPDESEVIKAKKLARDFYTLSNDIQSLITKLDNITSYKDEVEYESISRTTDNLKELKSSIYDYVQLRYNNKTYEENLYLYYKIIESVKITGEIVDNIISSRNKD